MKSSDRDSNRFFNKILFYNVGRFFVPTWINNIFNLQQGLPYVPPGQNYPAQTFINNYYGLENQGVVAVNSANRQQISQAIGFDSRSWSFTSGLPRLDFNLAVKNW